MSTSVEHKSDPENGYSIRRTIGLFLGPALFLIILLFLNLDVERPEVTRMAAVADGGSP